jgi:ferritin
MIKASTAAAINKQIQHEQFNAHSYQAVALYFEDLSLYGLAAWFKKQSEDERGHAQKFIDFLIDRGGKVELASIPTPKSNFDNPLEAVKHVLEVERTTTGLIHQLYETAQKEKDHAFAVALHWFITEQVEEEQSAEELVDLTEQFYKSPAQMFLLDHNWGKRLK